LICAFSGGFLDCVATQTESRYLSWVAQVLLYAICDMQYVDKLLIVIEVLWYHLSINSICCIHLIFSLVFFLLLLLLSLILMLILYFLQLLARSFFFSLPIQSLASSDSPSVRISAKESADFESEGRFMFVFTLYLHAFLYGLILFYWIPLLIYIVARIYARNGNNLRQAEIKYSERIVKFRKRKRILNLECIRNGLHNLIRCDHKLKLECQRDYSSFEPIKSIFSVWLTWEEK
jgi:hypothetical protein